MNKSAIRVGKGTDNSWTVKRPNELQFEAITKYDGVQSSNHSREIIVSSENIVQSSN